ncbi:MAG: NAD(P)/FAD-dependent oxidoreductase [Bryobacteraceae bacterium]|jgi:phytoene dehydrogenase-like protein
MSATSVPRRDVLKSILATLPVALDWTSLPVARAADKASADFDAVIIGSGLGGLSCAAAFARQGFRPLVIEQHDKPGGYATAFKRPGGFVFDVSLHATSAGQRNGLYNLIPGFPEITDVEFVQLPYLYRAIFPKHDIRVPQKNLGAYLDLLIAQFPEEKDGIKALYDDMTGVARDVAKFSAARGNVNMSRFPADFPLLFRYATHTWGEVLEARIRDPKLQAIVSAMWEYYGLPPSKLAAVYYAMPSIGYLTEGGYYPKGRSQAISNAVARFIEAHGGKVLLNTRVDRILTKDGAAIGVHTADGQEYKGRAVVANANAYDTFHKLMDPEEVPPEYLARMDQYTPSLSTFLVFLGLKKDLVKETGLKDAEIFCETGYDPESGYNAQLVADVSNPGFGMMVYDNVYEGYSPAGKNTLTLITLQGFDHWKRFEIDYWKGRKNAYRAEKERIASALIQQAERTVLPGLSKAIEVREIATPLTNVRYTGNYHGAIYGWDQTLNNSGVRRLPHKTPIRNLYLAGAWTSPGGGYAAVIPSGLQCFEEIVKSWG